MLYSKYTHSIDPQLNVKNQVIRNNYFDITKQLLYLQYEDYKNHKNIAGNPRYST